MFEYIQPYQYVAVRLPSDSVKLVQVIPSTLINFGKYGSFNTNQIIGRPFYVTFEILDRADLRILKPSEIHAETLLEEAESDQVQNGDTPGEFDEYGLPNNEKSNVNINDDPDKQKLTYSEIEALKSDALLNPRELISKIMANHSQLDQKTAFSLAKYTLRKQRKYMKRFTVLPLDVPTLIDFFMEEKDFTKILEVRNETLGLIGSWANIHASGQVASDESPRCRYLVVDDTGGLMVAAMAERMGILHHDEPLTVQSQEVENGNSTPTNTDSHSQSRPRLSKPVYERELATSNTITMVHANQQPNLALLRYFAFDPNLAPSPYDPSPHPLHTHLKTLSWLQLLEPENDITYSTTVEDRPQEEVDDLKANHKSVYYRKRRRWLRTREIVDSTREGGFDALIVASHTNSVGICKHLVPLLKGGAQIVVYNPHIEPLLELCDLYSPQRRAAYLNELRRIAQSRNGTKEETTNENPKAEDEDDNVDIKLEADNDSAMDGSERFSNYEQFMVRDIRFPVNPTLLLAPTVHKSVAKPWQVLPGRTHPLMMGKGGVEGGYIMVSTRVLPVQGNPVQARGVAPRRAKRPTELQSDATEPSEDHERSSTRGKMDEDAPLVDVESMDA